MRSCSQSSAFHFVSAKVIKDRYATLIIIIIIIIIIHSPTSEEV